jgi:hypothetical protein
VWDRSAFSLMQQGGSSHLKVVCIVPEFHLVQQISQNRSQVHRSPSSLHGFAAQGHRQEADPQSKSGIFTLLPQAAGEINHRHPRERIFAAEWGRNIGRRDFTAMLELSELPTPDRTKANQCFGMPLKPKAITGHRSSRGRGGLRCAQDFIPDSP